MKVEFEWLKEPIPLSDKKVIDFLLKKGMYFFCIVRKEETRYNPKTYKDDTIVTERVDTVTVHKNITVWGHDFYSPIRFRNETLLAYCILEFPENVQVHI